MGGKFKHEIHLKPKGTTFKNKKWNYNPIVEGKIFKEIEKILQARIIYPIINSTWVANIVLVRKKNGEIRICVDFKNLNQVSLKDKFSLLNMDHLLQTIVGWEMMSIFRILLDWDRWSRSVQNYIYHILGYFFLQ